MFIIYFQVRANMDRSDQRIAAVVGVSISKLKGDV